MNTSASRLRELAIANEAFSGDFKSNTLVGGCKVAFKIWKRRDDIITQATIMGLSLREKPSNGHSFDVGINVSPMHFRSVYSKMTLRGCNETTITTLYERRLQHTGTLLCTHKLYILEDSTATVRNTGIPHTLKIYSDDS